MRMNGGEAKKIDNEWFENLKEDDVFWSKSLFYPIEKANTPEMTWTWYYLAT